MSEINEIIDGLIFIKDGTKDMGERQTLNKACAILVKVERGELVEVSVLEEAYTVANNAIYFCDGSDYGTALYEICRILKPGTIEIGRKYIEQRSVGCD